MVVASRPTSSSTGEVGTRRCSWSSVIESTSTRMASTRRSARPRISQVAAPSSAVASGTPVSRAVPTVRLASVTASSLVPTWIVAGRPSGPVAVTDQSR